MKLYVSVDLEGLNGVCKFTQVEKKNHNEFAITEKQLYKELNALIIGAKRAGVDEIFLNDSHSAMCNMNLSYLDSSVSLITGKPKQVSMMAGLDETFNVVVLLGYHARAGAAGGVLAHTFSDDIISLKINQTEAGESYLNSLYAATKNVPVGLITGDEALKEEIYSFIGDVPFVETKKALGMYSAVCRPNDEFLKELEEKTYETLKNSSNWIINRVPSPYELEVEFTQAVMADIVQLMPGVKRLSTRKVQYIHPDFSAVYQAIQAMCILTAAAVNFS